MTRAFAIGENELNALTVARLYSKKRTAVLMRFCKRILHLLAIYTFISRHHADKLVSVVSNIFELSA